MKFLKGKVQYTTDPSNEGKFVVSILGRPVNETVVVNYVSPFFDYSAGGMFAVPPPGSEVCVIFDNDLNEYFYMGTIVGKSKFNPNIEDGTNTSVVYENLAYNSDGSPCIVMLTDSNGAGLRINNHFDGPEKTLVKSVVLKSVQGHKLELSDNPKRDSASIKNKHQDGITITGDEHGGLPARSIEVRTLDSILTASMQGEITTQLVDGRDITLRNSSTGAAGGVPIQTAEGQVNPVPAGNVNLVSSWKDINIYCENPFNSLSGKAGRVLISTPQGIIQLKSGSDGMIIYSEGSIKIASAKVVKDVRVQALGTDIDNEPNDSGVFDSWEVGLNQNVNPGDVIAYVRSGASRVPVVSPYAGTLLAQSAQSGSPVRLRSLIGRILTSGGSVTIESDEDINLRAGGKISMISNAGIDIATLGNLKIEGAQSTINSSLKTTVGSSSEVAVAGPQFTMGALTSNISPTNGGGTIYAPLPTVMEPVSQASVGAVETTPVKGDYVLKKQS